MRSRISWLDLKIGGRRAFKQPGLSVIGVFGMAVAMTIGVVSFEIVANLLDSVLPVDEGDRIVSIGYWDSERNLPERHLLHDYAEWQEQMTTMETLAAFRDVDRNVALADGPGASARGALITSSAFRALRTEAQLGRALQPSDDDPGAPGVIVLGHQIWQSRITYESECVKVIGRVRTPAARRSRCFSTGGSWRIAMGDVGFEARAVA